MSSQLRAKAKLTTLTSRLVSSNVSNMSFVTWVLLLGHSFHTPKSPFLSSTILSHEFHHSDSVSSITSTLIPHHRLILHNVILLQTEAMDVTVVEAILTLVLANIFIGTPTFTIKYAMASITPRTHVIIVTHIRYTY